MNVQESTYLLIYYETFSYFQFLVSTCKTAMKNHAWVCFRHKFWFLWDKCPGKTIIELYCKCMFREVFVLFWVPNCIFRNWPYHFTFAPGVWKISFPSSLPTIWVLLFHLSCFDRCAMHFLICLICLICFNVSLFATCKSSSAISFMSFVYFWLNGLLIIFLLLFFWEFF